MNTWKLAKKLLFISALDIEYSHFRQWLHIEQYHNTIHMNSHDPCIRFTRDASDSHTHKHKLYGRLNEHYCSGIDISSLRLSICDVVHIFSVLLLCIYLHFSLFHPLPALWAICIHMLEPICMLASLLASTCYMLNEALNFKILAISILCIALI